MRQNTSHWLPWSGLALKVGVAAALSIGVGCSTVGISARPGYTSAMVVLEGAGGPSRTVLTVPGGTTRYVVKVFTDAALTQQLSQGLDVTAAFSGGAAGTIDLLPANVQLWFQATTYIGAIEYGKGIYDTGASGLISTDVAASNPIPIPLFAHASDFTLNPQPNNPTLMKGAGGDGIVYARFKVKAGEYLKVEEVGTGCDPSVAYNHAQETTVGYTLLGSAIADTSDAYTYTITGVGGTDVYYDVNATFTSTTGCTNLGIKATRIAKSAVTIN